MKHTPEPWVSHDNDYCPEEIYGALDGPLEDGQVRGELVCTVNMEHDRAFANIALIKAAPALLATCHNAAALLAVIQSGTRTDAGQQKELGVKWQSTEAAITGLLAELREVIAKATT